MPNYPILPSLSRAPAYESTRKVEDGTIADPMESGYVATRPRFTRLRRTFGVSYKFLTAEDARVLDQFECSTVMGKAGAFYMPNLLPNGSFELADPDGGMLGWAPAGLPADPAWTIGTSTSASDGGTSVAFRTVEGKTVGNAYIQCNTPIPVQAGDVYLFNAQARMGTTYAETVALYLNVDLTYADGTTSNQFPLLLNSVPNGFAPVSTTVTIPAGPSGSSAAMATILFGVTLQPGPTDSGAGTSSDPSAAVLIDQVGMALTTAAQPYGRMPGLSPLGSLVRLSKGMQFKDRGWANGQKLYDVSFEITEV